MSVEEIETRALPEGWARTTLGELGRIVSGGTPSTALARNFDGDIPWVTPADLSGYNAKYISRGRRNITQEGLENSSATLVPEGSVLFSSRAPVGYVVIAAVPLTTNQGFKNLVLTSSMSNDYVYHYLKASKSLAESYASGTTFLELSGSNFAKLPIPLPPFNEQKRIVEKLEVLLSDLDTAVQSLSTALEKLKHYRRSVLKAAVEGELTQGWRATNQATLEPASGLLTRILQERRERWEAEQQAKGRKNAVYKEPAAPDVLSLPELPEGWVWATVEQLSSGEKYALSIGPFGSNLKVSDYTDSGVPLIFVRNIRAQSFGGPNAKYVTKAKAEELNSHKAFPGDILITKMGDPPGDACIYPDDQPMAVITADCIRWKIADSLPRKDLFVHVINSELGKMQIQEITRGVAQQKVSLGRFSGIAMPVPSLAEQLQIAQELERLFSNSEILEANLLDQIQHSESLRQSVLEDAFSGKLVPQDPNDEPATLLLERIREEKIRASQEAKVKKPKSTKPKTQQTSEPTSLADTLRTAGKALTPEELFRAAGYTFETKEQFFQDVRNARAAGLIEEKRLSPSTRDSLLSVPA